LDEAITEEKKAIDKARKQIEKMPDHSVEAAKIKAELDSIRTGHSLAFYTELRQAIVDYSLEVDNAIDRLRRTLPAYDQRTYYEHRLQTDQTFKNTAEARLLERKYAHVSR
jgi:hypothetical protein